MPSKPRALRTRVQQSSWKLGRAARLEVYAFWRSRPVDPSSVMYESFGGNGALCNPEAIFRGLRSDPELADLTHVWVLSSNDENADIVHEFAHDRSVRFVRPGSRGYYRALATSGYLINNATFPPEFSKRAGQTYLNTWHGTPLKRMGYDIGDSATRVANVIRNFLAADYLLSANRFMTEQLYETAHKLRGIFRGQVIEEGYPRIDRQFLDDTGVQEVRARLERRGLRLGDRKVILYAPTWKGASFTEPHDDAEELFSRVTELQAAIESSRYVVLLKTHQVVHKFAAQNPEIQGLLVPNEIPTNSVLAATDILVTDYSSTFFDFLATGRPIAFLAPDIADYGGYRGLYLEPGEWPGPVVTTVAELAAELNRIAETGVQPDVAARQRTMAERYCAHEDGNATSRIIDIVFRGKREGFSVGPITHDDRRSILVNVGGMHPGPVTTAAITLLNALDQEQFDVSAVFPYSRQRAVRGQLALIDPSIRKIARVGTINGFQVSHLIRRLARPRDAPADSVSRRQRRLWDDEWVRCFGQSSFDYVVDFNGYGRLWARLMLHAPGARRSIWLHDDLSADARAGAEGDPQRLRTLRPVFATYRDYDNLVSVSQGLERVNAAELAEFAGSARFTWSPDLVDAERVRQDAEAAPPKNLARSDAVTTFVAVGRLSAETKTSLLLHAFASVHAETPSTRLLIVGNGPLRERLGQLAAELALTDSVIFTGHRTNPHPILAVSDCFVAANPDDLQRTIVREAAVLGLPAVSGRPESSNDPDAGEPGDKDSLADGMRAFLRGQVAPPVFSPETHNRDAVQRFFRAIGAHE